MRARIGARLGLVFMLTLNSLFTLGLSPSAHATSLQPATFFLHKQAPKILNTVNSNLWSNTTQWWSFAVQTENRTVSSISPATWDFYTEPALAGSVTLTGLLNSTLYLGGPSITGGPVLINETVSQVTATGAVTPLVSAYVFASMGNKPRAFNLIGTGGTYQLETGSILRFTVTVTVTGPILAMISLYYDAPSNPSQVLLTFQSRVGTTSFQTYDQTGDETGFFSRNATDRQITFLAIIFDGLGTYDIALVRANVSSPSGSPILTNNNLTQVKGDDMAYYGTWELNYTYSNNDPSGAYTSDLLFTDNSGVPVGSTLSYDLFADWTLSIRTVTQDATPLPIPGVTVFVFTDAKKLVYFGISNTSGWLIPTVVLPDNTSYTIRSYWEGQWLSQIGPFTPKGPSRLSLSLSAYQVSFNSTFRDWNGNPLPHPPTGFQLSSPNRTVTSPDPLASYLLPAGKYEISQVLWNGQDVAPGTVSFNPKDGTPVIDLHLYDLTVFVVDQNGRPVPAAIVTLFQASQVVEEGTTGDQGTFTINDLTKGDYTAVVQSNHILQPVASKVSLSQTSTTSITVSLSTSPTANLNQSYLWLLLAGGIVAALAFSLKFSKRIIRRDRNT